EPVETLLRAGAPNRADTVEALREDRDCEEAQPNPVPNGEKRECDEREACNFLVSRERCARTAEQPDEADRKREERKRHEREGGRLPLREVARKGGVEDRLPVVVGSRE